MELDFATVKGEQDEITKAEKQLAEALAEAARRRTSAKGISLAAEGW
jgi:hypothetical protein